MHWADHTAQTLQQRGDSHVIASGITPSGEFHVGHLRERERAAGRIDATER